jgi:GNAT superfamily N-acetyltransferase
MTTFVAKQVSVSTAKPEDLPLLEQMYDTFSPLGATMGLPPSDPERRKDWLKTLLGGINLIAMCEDQPAGHLALMLGGRSAEMAIFVHQAFRRRGVATALANEAVRVCRQKGLHALWVLISSDNNAARRGLLNYGFHTAWESLGEVRMDLSL